MKITYKKNFDQKDKILLIPVSPEAAEETELPEFVSDWVKARISKKDFQAKVGEMITYFSDNKNLPEKVIFLGLGRKEHLDSIEIRGIIASGLKSLTHTHDGNEITMLIPKSLISFGQELAEGMILANYHYSQYKTGKAKEELAKKQLQKINFIFQEIASPDQNTFKKEFERGVKIAESVNFVRDLVNGPPNFVNADYLAEQAKIVASKSRLKIKVFDKKQLEKMKMGAILAVNKGSEIGAKLVVIEYLPLGTKVKPVILVGKGVTFDTGGYNLKPSQGLDWMHMDMAGSAVVLGTMNLLKQLNIKKNVIGIFPLTDNAVSSEAQKPSEIITSYSGKTIEVGNTDAEGRLVLADAISYAVKNYNPEYIVDIATLTGACRAALGERYAGLFGNNEDLKDKLLDAGEKSDELLWLMPIHPDHHKAMKSKVADLNNLDMSGLAGGSTGAAFIEEFVEKKPWAHLDIAGVTNVKSPKKYDSFGATGFGVRLLVKFLEEME